MKIIAAMAVALVIVVAPISLGPTNPIGTPHADLTDDAAPLVVPPDWDAGALASNPTKWSPPIGGDGDRSVGTTRTVAPGGDAGHHVDMGGTGAEAGEALGTSVGELQCLLCEEHHVPDNKGNGHWFHGFQLGSAQICEDNPGAEMCRACGETSECHDAAKFNFDNPQDVYSGRCHKPCAPAYVLLELSSEVSQLASSVDTQSMASLAQMIDSESHLEFDPKRNAVRLIDCGDVVRKEWIVDAVAELLPATIP